jgi:hypothetical protein
MLSVRTSANGHGRGERSGPRTWDTFAQRIDDTPPLSPRSSAQRSTTTEKKNLAFFGRFWPSGPAEPGWTARGGPATSTVGARAVAALIAQ